ncbi:MAG: hypothetical protein K2O54_00060, partial [Prevotella sp.]|nr:hypothetical protein [Prevotella sp.]
MGKLSNWKAEGGWDNKGLNANLATTKDGYLYTTNFRSIYYDMESIPDAGVVEISMNIFSEYAFRIIVSGTTESRNPTEKAVMYDLWKTILFHVNMIPENGHIVVEPYFGFDDGDAISSTARENREYHVKIVFDYDKKSSGSEWIGLEITNPEDDSIDVPLMWFNSPEESDGYLPAQIRLVFKSKRKSRNIYRTFLKDFEITYSEEAAESGSQNTDEYLNWVDGTVFHIGNMNIDSDGLTMTDLINDIRVEASMGSTSVVFPSYKYNDRVIY